MNVYNVGPDFQKSSGSNVPSAFEDLAPTVGADHFQTLSHLKNTQRKPPITSKEFKVCVEWNLLSNIENEIPNICTCEYLSYTLQRPCACSTPLKIR